jgi:tetratricopeptide (TPR) repeat protein
MLFRRLFRFVRFLALRTGLSFSLSLGLSIGLLGACAHAAADSPVQRQPTNRTQALQALESPSPEQRLAAVARLSDLGTMADADKLVSHLRDTNLLVRQLSGAALWQIWSRSGDKAIDALYQQGVEQMEAQKFREAVATFTAIIARRPAFAEAWNKRATLYYLLGELDLSLKDCDEVMKRNRNHYGALSGVAQIYLKKGDLAQAANYFEQALKVNPNLEGIAEVIEQLQQKLEEKRRNTI